MEKNISMSATLLHSSSEHNVGIQLCLNKKNEFTKINSMDRGKNKSKKIFHSTKWCGILGFCRQLSPGVRSLYHTRCPDTKISTWVFECYRVWNLSL